MHPAPGLVCSDRPEGRLLSCFDPSATQTVPTVCVRGSGMAVQGPPLRAVPVPPVSSQRHGGRPCPATGSGHQDPQLSRAWPACENSCVITGTQCFSTQPVGASGQLGKEQALPRAEKLFSQYGVRLGECGGASHQRACPVRAELPEFLQRQDGGTTETLFRGSWGIWHPQPQSRRSGCFI